MRTIIYLIYRKSLGERIYKVITGIFAPKLRYFNNNINGSATEKDNKLKS